MSTVNVSYAYTGYRYKRGTSLSKWSGKQVQLANNIKFSFETNLHKAHVIFKRAGPRVRILDQFASDEQFGGQPIYSLLKAPELAMFMVWTRAWYS